jgi:pimeloyl-ACP methyl ester carboxylesterase
MPRVATSIGSDVIAVSEKHVIVTGSDHGTVATAVPVIYCHHAGNGYAGTAHLPAALAQTDTDVSIAEICRDLAAKGHPVIASDQAGVNSWSNNTAVTAVDGALTLIGTRTGCRTDRVLLLADSMGTLLALNWARANASKVAAMALLLPAPDMQYVHDNASAPLPANMEAAYGGLAALTAAYPTKNAALFPSSYTSMEIQMWASTDDPICTPVMVNAFAAATGIPVISMGAVGHTIPSTFDRRAVVDYLHRNA